MSPSIQTSASGLEWQNKNLSLLTFLNTALTSEELIGADLFSVPPVMQRDSKADVVGLLEIYLAHLVTRKLAENAKLPFSLSLSHKLPLFLHLVAYFGKSCI